MFALTGCCSFLPGMTVPQPCLIAEAAACGRPGNPGDGGGRRRLLGFVFSFFNEIIAQGHEVEADHRSEAHSGNHGDGQRTLEL